MVIQTFETDDFASAKSFYYRYINNPDCWTQVFLEGEPLNWAGASRLFAYEARNEIFRQQMIQDAYLDSFRTS